MTQAVFNPCIDDGDFEAEIELNRASLRLLQSTVRANLPSGTKFVAMMLCCHHNDEIGFAWPSVARLAKLCGMHRRTVENHLAALKEMGLTLTGKVPGVRTLAYALQENALQSIILDGVTLPKNTLGNVDGAAPKKAPNAVNPAKNAGNAAQGTEGTEGTAVELKNGGGTDARATPPAPAPAPAPATPAAPEPAPSPALFASQPPQPEQPTAPADDATAFAQLVDRINAQRASNGKPSALTLADLHQLHIEAAKAGITPMQAAEWVLKSKGRNFFKADYFAPPAPAPVAPTAPAQPAPQPAPAPALTAEQCAKQEAVAAAARAKLKAMFAQPARAATPAPAQAADTLVVPKTGHAWADSAIAEALAGQPVAVRRLEMACEVAKVSYHDVRAAGKRAAAALTAIAA